MVRPAEPHRCRYVCVLFLVDQLCICLRSAGRQLGVSGVFLRPTPDTTCLRDNIAALALLRSHRTRRRVLKSTAHAFRTSPTRCLSSGGCADTMNTCKCYFNKNKRVFSGRGVLAHGVLRLHAAQYSMHASWHGQEDCLCSVCFLYQCYQRCVLARCAGMPVYLLAFV